MALDCFGVRKAGIGLGTAPFMRRRGVPRHVPVSATRWILLLDAHCENALDYVNANPTAFTGAYFEFNALTIYE